MTYRSTTTTVRWWCSGHERKRERENRRWVVRGERERTAESGGASPPLTAAAGAVMVVGSNELLRRRQQSSGSGSVSFRVRVNMIQFRLGSDLGISGFGFQVRVKQCSGQPPVKDAQRWSKVRLGQFRLSFGSVNRSQQQICAVAGFEDRVDSVKPSQLS
ncbi:hypothetical protein HanOQP8_Chr13g0487751 [Helianthus annuus]|uniref:Uncharacterized protein n=1 Tax=Helianthus annuus TaxID=4232 RepID=A0A251ST58_HELAN|nr:hypothetical protein HanIR_Chr13g0645931 [Helianthus annuus]KAJ0671635.1 hypothetical protein HanOQP8_Chr13g0487751 [Helianthus annuus]